MLRWAGAGQPISDRTLGVSALEVGPIRRAATICSKARSPSDRLAQAQTCVGVVQDLHNRAERLEATVAPTRPVGPAGSRDSRSSVPWPCQAANFCRPASSKASSPASVRAEPRCSTIRRTPPDLDTICTAVAPEAVLTLRTNGLTPVHHTDS